MNFRRQARRFIDRQVEVDTVNETYVGRLAKVEYDVILLCICHKGQNHLIIIRIDEIVALSAV
ncbi:hypothetical protein ACFQPF_14895 [Fictibacillus iocasae]|uniref:DUF2642 domain-containing protein n=1 Tax=Fictibacillus iocasae TaxID=2715437 RepID=A0ABW2NTS5_9BACL